MMKAKEKIKILVWGDTPACATGFATVIRNVFMRLDNSGKYEITILGINDMGEWKDPAIFGGLRIHPALMMGGVDVFGRNRLVNTFLFQSRFIKPPFDILFTLNDPFVLEENIREYGAGTLSVLKDTETGYKKDFPAKYWFKIASYWPIDSPLKDNWYTNAITKSDYSTAYSDYGKKEIEKVERRLGKSTLENPLDVIYHGVDTKTFKPIPRKEVLDFRKMFFQGKVKEDTFLVMIVARNQPRKDLPRAMMAFREFQKRRPDSFLYIHSKEQDVGGSLAEYGSMLGLKQAEDFGFPHDFSEHVGFPVDILNILYNNADVLMSASLGEGFGLPYLEAMSAGTLNIAPDNTTTPELFNIEIGTDVTRLDDQAYLDQIRGIGVKSGSTSSEFFCQGLNDKERFRPLMNVDDMVKKLIWAYDNPDKVVKVENRAKEWVQQYDWDIIAKKWDEKFQSIYDNLQIERASYVPPKAGELLPERVKINLKKKTQRELEDEDLKEVLKSEGN